jgi:hypothetical protein
MSQEDCDEAEQEPNAYTFEFDFKVKSTKRITYIGAPFGSQ